MCGIGGIKRMGERPITSWQVRSMGASLEWRGNDATGIAIQNKDGSVHVLKNHEPAWQFMSKDHTLEFLKKYIDDNPEHETVLVHTRKQTKGSQFRNENNHPMFSGKSAVVHNGVIWNDDQLFKELSLKRGAETDSDILRAIIDKIGFERKLIGRAGLMNRVSGSVAAAAVHPGYPGKLLLLRSNNPLMVASNSSYLAWASSKRSCYLVLRRWINRWGIDQQVADQELAFINMPNNSAWLIGKELEWHDEFSASTTQRIIHYDVHNTSWKAKRDASRKAEKEKRQREEEEKKAQAAREASPPAVVGSHSSIQRSPSRRVLQFPQSKRPDYVICPGNAPSGEPCGTILDLTNKPADQQLCQMECCKCHTNLDKAAECDNDGVRIQ